MFPITLMLASTSTTVYCSYCDAQHRKGSYMAACARTDHHSQSDLTSTTLGSSVTLMSPNIVLLRIHVQIHTRIGFRIMIIILVSFRILSLLSITTVTIIMCTCQYWHACCLWHDLHVRACRVSHMRLRLKNSPSDDLLTTQSAQELAEATDEDLRAHMQGLQVSSGASFLVPGRTHAAVCGFGSSACDARVKPTSSKSSNYTISGKVC